MSGLVRTIIADDHAIIREGLKQLLSTVDALTVSGEAADGEAVHRLLNESSADLLILDLGMPGVSGFQFIADLRTQWPELRVLVLTANVEPRSVRAAFSAGANGYLTKGGDPSELIAAIDAIRKGTPYVAEEVRFAVDQHDGPNETPEPTAAIMSPVTLTRRERQILGMIPHGATSRDIASRLGISPLTARKHRENLMRKLDLHSSAELTAYAIRLGLPAG
jgi:DNA-binding NarL/FixJ family response regulator